MCLNTVMWLSFGNSGKIKFMSNLLKKQTKILQCMMHDDVRCKTIADVLIFWEKEERKEKWQETVDNVKSLAQNVIIPKMPIIEHIEFAIYIRHSRLCQ